MPDLLITVRYKVSAVFTSIHYVASIEEDICKSDPLKQLQISDGITYTLNKCGFLFDDITEYEKVFLTHCEHEKWTALYIGAVFASQTNRRKKSFSLLGGSSYFRFVDK
ncbi:MAG: hypothetical protein HOI80_01360 [Alphaproteobacteria bacterium]|nr:hypothetical protein [Alphaproteobacteria bacterium]MBT5390195.1 hypothetical protein [Alphaproteobacteria bacterium]MBT5540348.1 hypothetical protein [Alphaproteobacteria bacterium]MBT5654134.1 hypothetical protein [Alphaproteobacteria bacterium]